MFQSKTHREVKTPHVNARYLADFMAASETSRRSIIKSCKYPPIARIIQHDEAKTSITKFLAGSKSSLSTLNEDAAALRARLADDEFYRDLYDSNALYIERFALISDSLNLPEADILHPGRASPLLLEGVRVTMDMRFRLRRLTRTNKVRIGAGMLRYAKGKTLPTAVAAWQSALMHGYLKSQNPENGAEVDGALCVTLDVHSGICHRAPGDAVSRFKNMAAACATISERWDAVKPPPSAIL